MLDVRDLFESGVNLPPPCRVVITILTPRYKGTDVYC